MKANCSYPGCLGLGLWKPIISIKTSENDRGFSLEFQYGMCDKHKEILKLDDIVGDKNIKEIRSMFVSKNIFPPNKKDMTLRWESIFMTIQDDSGFVIGSTPVKR